MVDSTSPQNLLSQGFVHAEDRTRIESATKTWICNIDASIKLRQKGTTMMSKLPNGVFRYMLDYQFPNELCFRYSEPCGGRIKSEQDKHFPAIEKLNYYNQLVAVIDLFPPSIQQYQFTLKDGANCGTKGSGNYWPSLQISQPQAQISKIEIGYNPIHNNLGGLKFYSKEGAVVLKTGWDWINSGNCYTHTVHLQNGERVIGFKSRTCPNIAVHCDF